MLKILQARLQQYMNCELPDVQVGFSKGRGTRDQIANICWIIDLCDQCFDTRNVSTFLPFHKDPSGSDVLRLKLLLLFSH